MRGALRAGRSRRRDIARREERSEFQHTPSGCTSVGRDDHGSGARRNHRLRRTSLGCRGCGRGRIGVRNIAARGSGGDDQQVFHDGVRRHRAAADRRSRIRPQMRRVPRAVRRHSRRGQDLGSDPRKAGRVHFHDTRGDARDPAHRRQAHSSRPERPRAMRAAAGSGGRFRARWRAAGEFRRDRRHAGQVSHGAAGGRSEQSRDRRAPPAQSGHCRRHLHQPKAPRRPRADGGPRLRPLGARVRDLCRRLRHQGRADRAHQHGGGGDRDRLPTARQSLPGHGAWRPDLLQRARLPSAPRPATMARARNARRSASRRPASPATPSWSSRVVRPRPSPRSGWATGCWWRCPTAAWATRRSISTPIETARRRLLSSS